MINLIIGGGSIKGIAYTGALEYLYTNNLLTKIKKFYGSSVGSIIGVFFCSGYKPYNILQILLNLNFEECWDFSLNNIDKNYSIITNLFFIKIREIYSKNGDDKITFKKFYDKFEIDLNIYATSLTSRQNICFNKDTFPNLEVFTAVQASSSIPIIFPPVIINNEYYVDGCMKCIDGVCSDIIFNNPHDINYIIKSNYKYKEIGSILDYISEVINCTLQNEDEVNNEYTINLTLSHEFKNKYNFNDLNFNSKIKLYYEGLIQAQNKIKPLIEKLEKDKLEKEKLEKDKLEKEKLEKEKLEKEKQE